MRHRMRGRRLGRNGAHRVALFRNLSRSIILTCDRDTAGCAIAEGRIRTTLEKAKEVRRVLERLITVAVKAKRSESVASKLICSHARGSDEWKSWRSSNEGQIWLQAQSRYIQSRRQLFNVLRSRRVINLLLDKIAPRFMDRPGGYTRVVRIANRRLADGARLAYLELVGEATRLAVTVKS